MAAPFRCALAILIVVLVMPHPLLRGGGPRTIAGTSYFDPAVKGTALTWNQGVVNYYTDRGNLSPVLPAATADGFVADAFSRWTSISTAAVSAGRAGQLSEDVSGANVGAAGGTITLPADIQPSASHSGRHRLRRRWGRYQCAAGSGRRRRGVPASPMPPTAAWIASAPTLICCMRW